MPTITLTNEQMIELIKQLPLDQQDQLLQYLITQRWRSACARGCRATRSQLGHHERC